MLGTERLSIHIHSFDKKALSICFVLEGGKTAGSKKTSQTLQFNGVDRPQHNKKPYTQLQIEINAGKTTQGCWQKNKGGKRVLAKMVREGLSVGRQELKEPARGRASWAEGMACAHVLGHKQA